MASKIIHVLDVNVETRGYSVSPVLDIHQGDANSHILLIKLHNNSGNPIQIVNPDEITVSIYDSMTNKLIVSSSVEVVNAYRGVVAYLIGPTVVDKVGRKTIYLKINNCDSNYVCDLSLSFTLTVSRVMAYDFDSSKAEVALTVKDYDTIMDHVEDKKIHLDASEKEYLEKFVPKSDELEEFLDEGLADIESRVEGLNPGDADIIKKAIGWENFT